MTVAGRTGISRATVHDRDGAVAAHELQFATGSDDRSTALLIATAFGDFGVGRLGGRRGLFVTAPRALLTGEVPLPFEPLTTVLEMLSPLEVDADVLGGVHELKRRGFRVLIDDRLSGPELPALLPLVDVVRVDVSAAGPALGDLVGYLRSVVPQAKLLAACIEDEDGLQDARGLGFDLYSGPHLRPPPPPGGVGPSSVTSLRLLAALSDQNSSIQELVRIVAADPGLSVRVLSAVNSAAGAGQRVTSLRQAIVLLGRRALSGWVMLAALGGSATKRREDLIDVLTRARTCERLAAHADVGEPSALYVAGLLSAVAQVMGADPNELARRARLGPVLTEAVVQRQGPVGALLDAVEEFDRSGATPDGIPMEEMSRAQLDAFATAVETVDAIIGVTAAQDADEAEADGSGSDSGSGPGADAVVGTAAGAGAGAVAGAGAATGPTTSRPRTARR